MGSVRQVAPSYIDCWNSIAAEWPNDPCSTQPARSGASPEIFTTAALRGRRSPPRTEHSRR